MARKGKNRPKKLSAIEVQQDVAVPRGSAGQGSIILADEPDAERMILESLEKLGRQGFPGDALSKVLEDDSPRGPAKAQGRDSGRSQTVTQTIDLHRMTLDEAKAMVDRELRRLTAALRVGERIRVRIVTGKGRHSGKAGAVLPREIHQYVRRAFQSVIISIEESPADAMLGDLPLRGHFDVVVGR